MLWAQVSGLDPDTEEEELYAATREGLGAAFDVNSTEDSISVSIDDSVNNSAEIGITKLADVIEEKLAVVSPDPMVPVEIRQPPLENGQSEKGGVKEGGEGLQREGGDVRYLVSANDHLNIDGAEDIDETTSLRSAKRATMPKKDTWSIKGTRHGVRGGSSSSNLSFGDMNHFSRGKRSLQTEGETTTAVVTMDFQVTLPKDDQQSASSRMASAVIDLADSGITAVADALGVAPENVRCGDSQLLLAFCSIRRKNDESLVRY